MKTNKKRVLCIGLIVFAVLLMTAVFLLTNQSFGSFLQNVIFEKKYEKECIEQVLDNSSIEVEDYYIKDGFYKSESNDPKMNIAMNIDKLANISILFKEPIPQNLLIRVYYNLAGTGYIEENTKEITVLAGEEEAVISILKVNVQSIRIDIGDRKGQEFSLDKIIINDKKNMAISKGVKSFLEEVQWGRFFYQWELLSFFLLFLIMHFLFDVRHMYIWFFSKRWIIGAIILLFLVANRFNGDSLSVYDKFVQPGSGSEFVEPIWGKDREIRSDEYAVDSPGRLAAMSEGVYGKYNEICRGTKTLNSVNGIYLGYSTIARAPYQFVCKILPREYAYSFCWYVPIILSFLVAIEFFYILSKRDKLLAVTGAMLEICSSFFLWWGIPTFLLGAQGALVCVYYFIYEKKYYRKIIYGLGVALSFAHFVLILYPAWLVPMGYVALVFLIWLIHDNWTAIKKFGMKEWLLIGVMGAFAISLIASYMLMAKEYTEAITNTFYPGKRISTGGGSLNKIFNYAQSYLFAFKEFDNSSENGVVLSFFPIPTIVIGYQWLKQKKKDWLVGGLLLVTGIFLLYIIIGVPAILAKALLLSYSMPMRVIDVLGIVQIYFIVLILSRYKEQCKLKCLNGLVLSGVTAIVSVYICKSDFPDYLTINWMIVSFLVIFACGTMISVNITKKTKNILCSILIGISIITGIYVRPMSVGLDAVTSKPISKKMETVINNDSDSKWLTYGEFRLSGFAVANGASTINSVNTYPNLALWKKLDKNGKYEKIYNRYAHITVEFTNAMTTFKLLDADQVRLKLSYADIKKTKVKYILSLEELKVNNEYVRFKEIYNEQGAYIYEVLYKQ